MHPAKSIPGAYLLLLLLLLPSRLSGRGAAARHHTLAAHGAGSRPPPGAAHRDRRMALAPASNRGGVGIELFARPLRRGLPHLLRHVLSVLGVCPLGFDGIRDSLPMLLTGVRPHPVEGAATASVWDHTNGTTHTQIGGVKFSY